MSELNSEVPSSVPLREYNQPGIIEEYSLDSNEDGLITEVENSDFLLDF